MNLAKIISNVDVTNVIEVEILEEFGAEYLARYGQRGIIVDPFTTDYVEESDCPVFEGMMKLQGEWCNDDKVFLVTGAESLR